MNLGTVTKPNSKGQIVIPKKYRDKLGVDEKTFVNIVLENDRIYIEPVSESFKEKASNGLLLDILKLTAGSWAGEDWEKLDMLEKRRRNVELKASKLRKKAW